MPVASLLLNLLSKQQIAIGAQVWSSSNFVAIGAHHFTITLRQSQ
jgi:hypothetical protein